MEQMIQGIMQLSSNGNMIKDNESDSDKISEVSHSSEEKPHPITKKLR